MLTIKELKDTLEGYDPRPQAFQPFKLTFHMMTPVCLAHPWIHLDGILAHVLLRKLLGEAFYTLPSSMPIDFFRLLDLPLKKLHCKDLFIYHASVSVFDKEKLYIDQIYKRFEDTKMRYMDPGRSRRIDITRGRFKNYMIKLPYHPSPTVTFYGNGNVKEVTHLINHLPGLGKKIAAGFGFFHDYSIDVLKTDKSIIDENGRAMRPIPVLFTEKGQASEQMMLAYKFPYWAKGNVKICIPPMESVILKEGLI